MALEIRETPILKGKAVEQFNKRMHAAEKKSIPKADYLRAEKLYNQMMKSTPVPA